MYDICIIGCGASGMAAAVTMARINDKLSICILEKNKIPGRKLLATGNGRCNLSNEECENNEDVMAFFEELGVITRTDDEGRIYPYSEQGSQVVDSLVSALATENVTIKYDFSVKDISFGKHFEIETDGGEIIKAGKLLISTGGKAAPEFGTTGDGYRWAEKAGHKVTRLAPVLTALECEGDFAKIKGVRAKSEVYLFKDGDMIARERGELQITKDGLSGICIFNISSEVKTEDGESLKDALKRYRLSVDLAPDFDEEELITILNKKRANTGEIDDCKLLETIVNTKIAEYFCDGKGEDTHQIAEKIKYWDVKITGVKGWKNAQCTSGGVRLDEINSVTMESKFVKGLYFAGEILDYDGPCGGFNLNNAWSTGIRAGKAMAK